MCTATCAQLHKRAEKITATLLERGGLNTGDNVVLLYPPGKRMLHYFRQPYLLIYFVQYTSLCMCNISAGVDLIAAFYGCLYAGVIPVTVRPPHPQNLAATLPTVRMIIDVSSHRTQNTVYLLLLSSSTTKA